MNTGCWALRYLPERLRQRGTALCRMAAKRLVTNPGNAPTMPDIEALQRLAVEEYQRSIEKLPVEQRPLRPSPVISAMVSLAIHYASFYLAGRQIYDVNTRTGALLASADYRDVPASMLVLPFTSIYLHFGPQPFRIKGASFEGAFASIYQRRLQLVLTTAPTAGWASGNEVTHPTQYLYLVVDLSNADVDTPLGDLVAEAVDAEREQLIQAASIPVQESRVGEAVVIDRRGAGSQEDLENFELAIESLDDAMRLVVNTIIFITAYRENITKRWTEGTPDAVSSAADGAGRPKKVVEAKALAAENGYYKTNFVGERFECAVEGTAGSVEGVAPHWRRAHWRVQRFGQGLQERKVVLIKQVLVNASKLGSDQSPAGRVTKL